MNKGIPTYQENIVLYRKAYPILSINSIAKDLHPSYADPVAYCTLERWLFEVCSQDESSIIIFFSPVRGFFNDEDAVHLECFQSWLPARAGASFAEAVCALEDIVQRHPEAQYTLIITNASRLCSNPTALTESERDSFARLKSVFSPLDCMSRRLILLADNGMDIPPLLRGDHCIYRSVDVPAPGMAERRRFLRTLLTGQQCPETDLEKLAETTDGMYLIEIARNIANIQSAAANVSAQQTVEQLKLIKYGITENPWRQLSTKKLREIGDQLKAKVFGQSHAIDLLLANIISAKFDCSLGHSKKPKAVLVFGGPTGSGKSKLASEVAVAVFGSTDGLVRIDMSEYADGSSRTKITGSSPGYIGYGDRSVLLDPLKENPFRVILFDEMEKAHPDVLDVMLVMIDEGRLTSPMGETVSLEHSIIVFTTNLGSDRIIAGDPPLQAVNHAVKEHVRPELYGRLASGILAFHPLGIPEAVAIFERELRDLKDASLQDHGVEIRFEERILHRLREQVVSALSIETGGRGIVDAFKYRVRAPLSTFRAEREIDRPGRITINCMQEDDRMNQFEGTYESAVSPRSTYET